MKVIVTSSALLMSLSLVGCNTMDQASQYSNSTVGAGVKYGANVVGTGVGFIADTGAAVGNGVGKVVDTGVGVVTEHKVSYHKAKPQYVYYNGHRYMLQNGRYILVH
ncbi:hypothetical protein DGG96_02290 [Legionella qingyii]|uniref:Glycine zipper 2TM domain-containing protein n=1 Tax=Legionella qingyii TaxID=2184757 RepID=A0A317U6N3_9GAMM|nr:hypothetical protein [Legionella qingyii]PWY56484.1 hypothetical protein DGG96_06900 [Legionella qingyii]PWY57159.1 hypothetical protein DGG96_02290 [Legionella qingyii]RUR25001.1 hypothetical protein ELY20_04385 [Legionella qingyii]RUR28727.1 hypothetical protein ELY16_01595 [Legionella qingyii]